ncbi:methionine synthase I (cobalamin-dependent) [Arthrobacter sp. SLBN-112]|nr:methionine synthase I (cobalamin-dependent) [Arthrobacter sp. SLBN-112]
MPRFAPDIESVPRPVRSQELLDAVNHRVVIADGAMGTMLQGRDLQLETDFQNLEGCTEILNDTRPDVIADIHDAYFATGIDNRIEELALKGAKMARERSEAAEEIDGRMRWVLGSIGPGTKLPSLGHTSYDWLKQTFALQAEGLIDGGADAFLIETSQDLLQTKAAVNGCKQAIVSKGVRLRDRCHCRTSPQATGPAARRWPRAEPPTVHRCRTPAGRPGTVPPRSVSRPPPVLAP